MTEYPLRCWVDVDRNNCITFRGDVTRDEIPELRAMVAAAFEAGLRSGYKQGCERTAKILKEISA